MQRNIALLCCVAWLSLLCLAPVCHSAEKHPKCRHDRHTKQKTQSTKRFCDPSFSNQTAGAITQKCSSGFYREWTGPQRGQCVPCSCNGLSNECDERTGNCLNCQFNAAGDHCERCKEGYYGNAAAGNCHACPCPFTWNNFALACLDIGSGTIECLCKRGYSGPRCERCAYGYYGNPVAPGGGCKPCNCKDGTLNICDSLTGECIRTGDSSCVDKCLECNNCSVVLLVDLEKMDDGLARLKQQLQNISNGPGSLSRLNRLQVNISNAKILVENYTNSVTHLDPKVKQLEANVDVVRDDFSQLIEEALKALLDLEKTLQNVNATKFKAKVVLHETEALLTALQDLITEQAEVKPGKPETISESDKAKMMEEAQRNVQEMRTRASGCSAQRDKADREQKEAQTLLDIIRNMTAPVETKQTVINQIKDSLMESDSSLKDLAELLSDAENSVDRTQGLILKSHTTLQHLENLQSQLEREDITLVPLTDMSKDLLKNTTGIFLMLEKLKLEFESLAAQLDSAKPEVIEKLNNISQTLRKLDEADEHAKELNRLAAEFQHMLHNATNSSELLSIMGVGAYNGILNAVEKAEIAANLSRKAAGQALKDVKKGGLVKRAERLRDNSSRLWEETNKTRGDLKMLSQTMNTHRDRVNKQKEKGESLRTNSSSINSYIKSIRRDDTEILLKSAKAAASVSNITVSHITERLGNISQEVEGITVTNVSANVNNTLMDADRTLKNLNTALPVLKDKLTEVEALSKKVPPSANMTESIMRIKDVIEETRAFVNRLSIATTFNGKGHVELHPPRNLEDIKAFTAVDLLLNCHHNNSFKAEHRRKRRQGKRRDVNFFVFFLGNKDASGDYIGMAIRNNVLICAYKLGGVVHEVETSQITTTGNVNSPDFDWVSLHRVYQDAEINVTQKVTSEKPVTFSLKRNLPNSMSSILQLDPDNVVFYVGGYPKHFMPPVELRYPKYRGAMKFSYINDNPVCLFNYKHAANMDANLSTVKIHTSEVFDYYDGTGYRMVLMKEPDKIKRRLFKFHTSSRETDALLFYIGNEDSFFCVFVERSFLVLQGWQAGREIRLQSDEKVSLFDKQFAIIIAQTFVVHYGAKQISTDHNQTTYTSYYLGGLPAWLRQRHNITAPPLRGCVDHVTAGAVTAEYNRTIGVTIGCPVSLLGVRSATLYSALTVDTQFLWDGDLLRVSLGFRSTHRHGTVLRSSTQGSKSAHDLHLSLADGYVVLSIDDYTLRSDKRYNDGSWHYLSAVKRPTGLELSIDNVKVTQGQSPHSKLLDQDLQGVKFKACITNLYTRRPEQGFIPADLSSFSLPGDAVLGSCSVHPPLQTGLLPAPVLKKPQKHKPIQAPAGSQCKRWQAQQGEYQLSEEDSWLSYTLPQQDLNHRPHFSLDIKTKSSRGLIFHIAGRGVVPLLALFLANGKIKMSLGQNRLIQHKQKSDDGNWHRVEFSVEQSTFHLLVDGVRVTDGQLPNKEGSSLDLHNPVYLGGDPLQKNTKGHDIPTNSVTGCIRDFKMNEEAVGEPEASHRTSPCPDRLTDMGTYFDGGHIILDNYFSVGSQFVLAFELRPRHLTGLLFHVRSHKTRFDVFLLESKVGVKVDYGNGAVTVSVTPPESLCDGRFHIVTVSKQAEVIKLVVDSISAQKTVSSTSNSTTPHKLYIGGTTKPTRASVSSPFVGCLRNVKLNGRPVGFGTGSRAVGPVSINRCPAD